LSEPPATDPVRLPFIELQSVDSTNNYARRQIHAGLAQDGMAFFAHEQLAGRGQRGKAWSSQKDANIILSLLVNPQPLLLVQQFQLSACVAVSAQQFLQKYAGDDTKIKWPNDLYWQDRKAGGILIESVVGAEQALGDSGQPVSATWKWAIIGIGININQTIFHPEIMNPVSLKQITGKDFDVVELSKEFCRVFQLRFKELTETGFEPLYIDYLAHLYKRGETARLKKGSKVFDVMIDSVSPTGKLMTQQATTGNPALTGFDFGEVEWILT